MAASFEENLGIISVDEAIQTYRSTYPDSDLFKVSIRYKGPFLQYVMHGYDDSHRNKLRLNGQDGSVVREKQKALKKKRKARNAAKRQRRTLDVDGLKPLEEISQVAERQAGGGTAVQWQLKRTGGRSVWTIKFADETGHRFSKLTIDAHDGSLVQMKLK